MMEASLSFDPRRLRIGALLLRGGLLDAEQLAEALDEKEVTGERLGQIVLRRGWVTEEALAQTLADQSGLDFVDLDTATRESRAELMLSGKLARYFRCVPLAVLDGEIVLVAASDPTSPLLADLPSAIGYEIRVAVATETAVERVLAVIDPDGAPQSQPPLLDQPAAPLAFDPLVEPLGEPLLRLSVVPPAPADEPEPELEVGAEAIPESEDAEADTFQTDPEPAEAPDSEPERSRLGWHRPAVETMPDHAETAELQPAGPEDEPQDSEPEQADALLPEPEPSWLAWHRPAIETMPDHTDDPAPGPAQPELDQHEALPALEEPALEEHLPSWLEVSQSDLSEADQPAADYVEAEPERPWSLWLKPRHEQQPEPTLPTPVESDEEPAVADAEVHASSTYEAGPDGDSDPAVAAANEMIAAMTASSGQQLGTKLLQLGLLTPGQLVEVLLEQQETGMWLGTVIAGRGWISQTELARVLAEQNELDDVDVGAEPLGPNVFRLLPEASASEHGTVPVSLLEDETPVVPEAPELLLPSLGELWSRRSDMADEAEDSLEPDESSTDVPATPVEEAASQEPGEAVEPDVTVVEPDPDATALVQPEARAEAGVAAGLEELGLGPEAVAALRAALDQPQGLVLAVGPAISGRTTTLRTALDMLEEASRAVVAVEGRSAQGKALRMALQDDPGILLIDDLEHPGTARAAVEAALRGHLVLSTLHAPTPGSAVARLTGAGIERQVLAATLTCVVGQRLARRLCPTCRQPSEAGRASLVASGFGDTYLPASPFVGVYEPRGCSECDSGYAGRIGLFEALSVSAPIRRILETGNASDIDGAAAYGGTRTLLADGLRHCLAGRTTLAEVRRVVGARPV